MSTPSLHIHSFKTKDRVRILKKDDKDTWKTAWYGIIIKLGTTHALIWDSKKTDSNVGTFGESCEWISYESKMIKIVKD